MIRAITERVRLRVSGAFVCALIILCPVMAPAQLTPTETISDPQYIFTLSLPEFSMFNNALVAGLADKGGSAELKLRIVNIPQATHPWWVVSTGNENAVKVYRQWVSNELLGVVEDTDFNAIDPGTTRSLDSLGSLGRRLQFALENPVRPITRVSGVLHISGPNPVIEEAGGTTITLIGEQTSKITAGNDTPVHASGVMVENQQLQLGQIMPDTTNTLEVFTMPFCPYGQQAVPAIANYLDEQKLAGKAVPEMKVRYIFYTVSEDPLSEFYCLHGKQELDESVVQILIRDVFSNNFIPYLRARFRNPDAPWQQLAEQAGIDKSRIPEIADLAKTTARGVIQREYDYVHNLCGVENKSPTYFWKSQQIDNLHDADPFAAMNETFLPPGTCSQ